MNFIATVCMLEKNPAHNPQAKVTGPCPVSPFCTDVTGEHHSFLLAGVATEEEARAAVRNYGSLLGFRLTRLEGLEL